MAGVRLHSAIVARTAPAKVNLFLHVTGRRQDGYHELESLFVFTAHGDEVQVEASRAFRFQLSGPFAQQLIDLGGGGDENLVCRAARRLAARAGREPDVSIRLMKNLPVAAGIGGGSADAAATLLALNEFWSLNLNMEELETVALELGADVPACLHRQPLYVQGIGDRLTPAKLGFEAAILLVNPLRDVSTPLIFSALKESRQPFNEKITEPEAFWAKVETLEWQTTNSLQRQAVALCPEIRDVLDQLEDIDTASLVRMSGSGATCFALFQAMEEAEEAAEKLSQRRPEWWVHADRIIG